MPDRDGWDVTRVQAEKDQVRNAIRRTAARRVVHAHATDSSDEQLLLSMLGLNGQESSDE